MRADLDLDPDGLRRVARDARRIADGLDGVAGPLPATAVPDLERAGQDLRRAVLRARDELLALADDAAACAARAEDADRGAAARLRHPAEGRTGGPGDPAGSGPARA